MKFPLRAAVAGLLVVGCAGSTAGPVLTVGDRTMDSDEFLHLFESSARSDTTLAPDYAGLEKFANELADQLILEKLFLETEKELEPGRQDRYDDYRERRMVEHLRDLEIGPAYEVSEAELKRGYDLLSTRRHLRRMILPSVAEAHQIRRAIREGGLFDRIAMTQSLDDRTKETGGDLGWIVYTDLPPHERDAVFQLKAGEISEPLSMGGYASLYQCVEVDENHSRGTLEQERDALALGIQQKKVVETTRAYHKRLLDESGFKLNPAEVAWLTVHMREKTQGAVRGADVIDAETTEERDGILYSRGGLPWTGMPVLPADTSRVIATYADDKVGPLLVFDQLMTIPTPTWPTFAQSSDVEELVHDIVLERLEQAEAYRRNLDEAPVVIWDVSARLREIRGRQYIRNVLRTPNIPDEDVIRAEYEKNIEDYTSPEARRFFVVNLGSWRAAKEASEMMKDGAEFEEVRDAFQPDDNFRGQDATPPMVRQTGPLEDVIFDLEEGEVSEPIDVGGSYTVAKVLEIIPALVDPFEDVQLDIQVELVDQISERKKKEEMDAARERHPVTIDPAALRELESKL